MIARYQLVQLQLGMCSGCLPCRSKMCCESSQHSFNAWMETTSYTRSTRTTKCMKTFSIVPRTSRLTAYVVVWVTLRFTVIPHRICLMSRLCCCCLCSMSIIIMPNCNCIAVGRSEKCGWPLSMSSAQNRRQWWIWYEKFHSILDYQRIDCEWIPLKLYLLMCAVKRIIFA